VHPVLLQLGPLKIYAYGTFLALAFICGTLVSMALARRKGLNAEAILQAAVYIVMAAIAGSRLLYVLLNPGPYLDNPWSVLNLPDGGLSLHGGVLGGLLTGYVVSVRLRVAFWPHADVVAPAVALGTGIARVGCFLNGCCYGVLSSVPWATLTRYAPGLRHPSQIYEMLLDFGLFGYLIWRLGRPTYDGQVFLHYVIGYAIVRFVAEFWRDSGSYLAGMSLAQVASIAIALVFLGVTWVLPRWTRSGKPEAPAPREDTPS